MEEDIMKHFEELNEGLCYWVDDDMGGHYEQVIGDQKANTMLGYLIFKKELQNLINRNKELEYSLKYNVVTKYIIRHKRDDYESKGYEEAAGALQELLEERN